MRVRICHVIVAVLFKYLETVLQNSVKGRAELMEEDTPETRRLNEARGWEGNVK